MSALASPASTLGDQLQRALELHKSGDTDTALEAYLRLIPFLPPGQLASSINSNAGSILLSRGDYEGARERFAAAVDADPQSSQAHFNLAVTLSSKFGLDHDALKHCITAVKLNGRNHKAYHLMGNIFQNLGKETHAQKYFLMSETIAREDAAAAGGAVGEAGQETALSMDLPVFGMRIGDSTDIEHDGAHMSLECLSERPFISRVKNFAFPEECAHVIEKAEPRLEQSYLIGTSGRPEGASSEAAGGEYRTSKNTWLSVDKILAKFQSRIAHVTGLPASYVAQVSEELQVVKYDSAGATFRVHHDSSAFQQRMLTALVYLNDVDGSESSAAGETWFPFTGSLDRGFQAALTTVDAAVSKAQRLEEALLSGERVDSSAEEGNELRVKPVRGDAIIFFNHLPSGEIDPSAVHAGLPTPSDSTKWIANYWIQLDFDKLAAHSMKAGK